MSKRLVDDQPGAKDLKDYRTFFDATDNLANQGLATICIQHVPSKTRVYFKAFITTFNETYNVGWSEEAVYGRTDPIYLYKQTRRTFTLAFKVPGATPSESFENLGRVQTLIQSLYPNYSTIGSAQTIAQSPLTRIEVLNLTPSRNSPAQTFGNSTRGSTGVLCVINSVSIAHNIENSEAGVYDQKDGTYIPKVMEISIDAAVLTERTLGWHRTSFSDPYYPYGADVASSEGALQARTTTDISGYETNNFGDYPSPDNRNAQSLSDFGSYANRAAEAEANNTAIQDSAAAQGGGVFSDLISNRQQKKVNKAFAAREESYGYTTGYDPEADKHYMEVSSKYGMSYTDDYKDYLE